MFYTHRDRVPIEGKKGIYYTTRYNKIITHLIREWYGIDPYYYFMLPAPVFICTCADLMLGDLSSSEVNISKQT
jgi:hypothetical protein